MRVALVTALSWPAFAGGASLQVHRVATALRRRGHDVVVLSGARRPAERDLSMRQEEVDGISITSLNTEDFLRFDDRRNYDNPEAVAPILDWIGEADADVVHAHSLQGLGAGWIDAAAADRPVVVTMHDWWWICARQFLVREDLTIDAPLVDVAGCACAGGVAFNQERRAWLRERLGHTSRVLTPSEFLRQSLVLNGLDPGRIEVDPNGIDPGRAAQRPMAGDEGVPHLGFVGGAHELKGLPLLLEARRRLAGDPPPLRITAWGAGESPATRRPPAGFTVLPAYSPGDADRVFSEIDALAVPSLMRESFSLVTREALARGVPVICSDSGGPEEVVRDGDNGLVVESGSVAAWTSALERWSGDTDLRRRLRAGAGRGVIAAASPDQQAANLERVYGGLVPTRGATRGARRARAGAAAVRSAAAGPPGLVIVAGIEGAPLRYRAHNLAQAHRALGGRAVVLDHRDRGIPGAIQAGDVVVFYRVPWSSWVRECVAAATARGATTAFSVDDLVFDPGLRDRIPAVRALPRIEAEQWMEGVRRYQQTARACRRFIGSTAALLDAALEQGLDPVLFPNFLSTEVALLSQAARDASRDQRAARRAAGITRIGYLSGTTTHDADWALVEPAVTAILERFPLAELWLVGSVNAGSSLSGHPRVRRLGPRPYQELPRLHAELDIVLAPLEPWLEFSEAKSAIKWLEAAAAAVPVVASPTAPFREAIEHGVTGLLAAGDGWESAIARLVEDPGTRDRIGRAARAAAYARYGPGAAARWWSEAWPRLVGGDVATPDLPRAQYAEAATAAALEPEAPDGYLDASAPAAEGTTARLGGEAVLEARLEPRYPNLCRVDIQTSSFGGAPPADLELSLLDGGGNIVRSGRLAPTEIADDAWTAWVFEPVTASAGRRITLRLRQPAAPEGGGIAAWTGPAPGRDATPALCVRTWARPGRGDIARVAMNRPPGEAAAGTSTGRRLRMLWHRGRHSLRAQGVAQTAARTFRYGRRWLRARRPR